METKLWSDVEKELGITHRVFDHGITSGAIDLPHLKNLGPGHRRRVTETEILAIRDYVERKELLEEWLSELYSGVYFRERLRIHEENELEKSMGQKGPIDVILSCGHEVRVLVVSNRPGYYCVECDTIDNTIIRVNGQPLEEKK